MIHVFWYIVHAKSGFFAKLVSVLGLDSNIKKVNRHDKNAALEFEFLNNKLILPIEEVYL